MTQLPSEAYLSICKLYYLYLKDKKTEADKISGNGSKSHS